MGITIHHKLTAKKIYISKTLDKAEKYAHYIQDNKPEIGIQEIRRISPLCLMVDTAGCETLAFDFKTKTEIIAEAQNDRYHFQFDRLTDNGKKEIDNGYMPETYPQNELVFSSDFCKTQYSKSPQAHSFICEMIKIVASDCPITDINDEADYYYNGDKQATEEQIKRSGEAIAKLGETLKGQGFNIISGKDL